MTTQLPRNATIAAKRVRAICLGFIAFAASGACASWPDRPITIIAGAAPGGSTDILARVIATPLGIALGQPVIVENKAGAGGNIGSDIVGNAKPDGYTLLLSPVSSHSINQFLYKNIPRAVEDVTTIALSAT